MGSKGDPSVNRQPWLRRMAYTPLTRVADLCPSGKDRLPFPSWTWAATRLGPAIRGVTAIHPTRGSGVRPVRRPILHVPRTGLHSESESDNRAQSTIPFLPAAFWDRKNLMQRCDTTGPPSAPLQRDPPLSCPHVATNNLHSRCPSQPAKTSWHIGTHTKEQNAPSSARNQFLRRTLPGAWDAKDSGVGRLKDADNAVTLSNLLLFYF